MDLYSVIGIDGRIRLAQIVPNANITLLRGERLVLDRTPTFDGEVQRCTRVEPVDSAATEVSYVVEYLPLGELKAVARGRINRERDRREGTSFPYLGRTFDCDSRSVQRINTAVQAAQAALAGSLPFTLTWTDAENQDVEMTAEQVVAMPLALAVWGNDLHQTCRTLKQQIDAAETPEAVLAVTWPA